MTTSELVKQLCKEQKISISELSRRIGQSRQNLSKKLKRESLTLEELKKIATELNVSFEQSFVLPDGSKISINDQIKSME
ncbi:MAG: helix-turn-helix transcriptional regulator [Spirochaetales bacterium]|nr:helix-turn-helix transcriptional regulator [Spirochaetales bacterium]